MTVPEIMDKLRPALEKEGVEFEVSGQEGPTLLVRARRVAPGAPVAFLVKAIAGTFRRYHDEVKEVCLTEYDPGPEGSPSTARSPDFDRVLRQRPRPALTFTEIPGLDLGNLDRAEAMRALENAVKVWMGQEVASFSVHGLDQDSARRAFEKWLSFYGLARSWHDGGPGQAVVHLREACDQPDCLHGLSRMTIPGKVFLTPPPPEEGLEL